MHLIIELKIIFFVPKKSSDIKLKAIVLVLKINPNDLDLSNRLRRFLKKWAVLYFESGAR